MALKINTNIQNDIDNYLLDAKSVKGGYVVVSGIGTDTKENLPVATKVPGTLVFDFKEQKTYRWSGSEWIEEYLDAGDIISKVLALLATGISIIKADEAYSGDFYFDNDSIYAKDDVTGLYEPVISNILDSTELGTTDGHMFNDTDNTAYIGGNTKNPKYVSVNSEGQVTIEDIALKSDIHDVSLSWGKLGENN